MGKRDTRRRRTATRAATGRWPRLRRIVLLGPLGLLALVFGAVALLSVFNPPTTPYMAAEARRIGGVDHEWVRMDGIAPVMARAAVAAEDAQFCRHWGFDMAAIRAAIETGAERGGSTITQQVVKNVFLWQGRSWTRKALESLLTPLVEAIWTKRRILEVYLNVAEFGEGVFGIGAAARRAFGADASDLSAAQAARLAAILSNPKARSAARPSDAVAGRAAAIRDGAAVIARDGRAACFERDGAG